MIECTVCLPNQVGEIYDLHVTDPLTRDYSGPHKYSNNCTAVYVKERIFTFFAAGIGGPYEYSGKNMVDAHSNMVLHDQAFHALSYHVLTKMKEFGAGGEREREQVQETSHDLAFAS